MFLGESLLNEFEKISEEKPLSKLRVLAETGGVGLGTALVAGATTKILSGMSKSPVGSVVSPEAVAASWGAMGGSRPLPFVMTDKLRGVHPAWPSTLETRIPKAVPEEALKTLAYATMDKRGPLSAARTLARYVAPLGVSAMAAGALLAKADKHPELVAIAPALAAAGWIPAIADDALATLKASRAVPTMVSNPAAQKVIRSNLWRMHAARRVLPAVFSMIPLGYAAMRMRDVKKGAS